MRLAGFVIHLSRARARQPLVEDLRQRSPVPLQVLEAVDGARLTEAEVDAVYRPHDLVAPRYPFALGRGEIGCFLSHRRAWQAILDSGAKAGLVFEDDAVIDLQVFPAALAAAAAWAGPDDLIEFQTRPVQPRAAAPPVALPGGFQVIEPEIPPVRLTAQLVGAGAAARLLEATWRFDRPVDGVVQLLGVTGQRVLCLEPSGVTEASAAAGGTTIQSKGAPLLAKLARGWQRAAYRRAVRAHVAAARAAGLDQRV